MPSLCSPCIFLNKAFVTKASGIQCFPDPEGTKPSSTSLELSLVQSEEHVNMRIGAGLVYFPLGFMYSANMSSLYGGFMHKKTIVTDLVAWEGEAAVTHRNQLPFPILLPVQSLSSSVLPCSTSLPAKHIRW